MGDVDLAPLVDAVTQAVSATATGKGLRFVCQRDPDTPATIRGDAERIRQMLLNLATNAIKFTERGEVVIRVGLVEAPRDTVRPLHRRRHRGRHRRG